MATLYQDVDALLEKAGFTSLQGSGVIVESSKSLNSPDLWIYPYLIRGYKNQSPPFKLISIGIFFTDVQRRPIHPLLIFGIGELETERLEELRSKSTFVRDAWFSSGDNKAFYTKYPFSEVNGVRHGFVQGLALGDVRNVEVLRELVIEPLVED